MCLLDKVVTLEKTQMGPWLFVTYTSCRWEARTTLLSSEVPIAPPYAVICPGLLPPGLQILIPGYHVGNYHYRIGYHLPIIVCTISVASTSSN